MKVLIQVVKKANVKVNNKKIAKIKEGYVLFVGFSFSDKKETIDKMVEKIVNLRILPDKSGKVNLNISQKFNSLISVPQFTLYANSKKGNRPSFTESLSPIKAKELFDYFNKKLSDNKKILVQEGEFGASMLVSLKNTGPFTIMLDSEHIF